MYCVTRVAAGYPFFYSFRTGGRPEDVSIEKPIPHPRAPPAMSPSIAPLITLFPPECAVASVLPLMTAVLQVNLLLFVNGYPRILPGQFHLLSVLCALLLLHISATMSNRDRVFHARCFPLSSLTLASSQLKETTLPRYPSGAVLSMAAGSTSKDTFEAVLTALEDKLTSAKVIVESSTGLDVPLTCYRVGRWRTALGP